MEVPTVRVLLLIVYITARCESLPCIMSTIVNDVNMVMNLFKEAAEGHGGNQNKLPDYMIHGLRVLVENIFERQDNINTDLKENHEKQLKDLKENYDRELSDRDSVIDKLRVDLRKCIFDIDGQAQYNRSENFKIHGVVYKSGEDVNTITKDLGKYSGVKIEDGDISCGHRLMSKSELEKRATSSQRNDQAPPIIVRLNRRDLKDKLLVASKNIRSNSECPEYLKGVRIYEDVTPLRSRMMYQLRQRDDKKAFKYVWSRGGRIFVRTHEEAEADPQPRPHVINHPDDLSKVGFSESEIEAIIKGNQNN